MIRFLFSCVLSLMPLVGYADVIGLNDGDDLDVRIEGLKWTDHGGGHVYLENYKHNGYIHFNNSVTALNSFQMNALPYEGDSQERVGKIDINGLNSSGTVIWSYTADLRNYDTWDKWLTIEVNQIDISTLEFIAPIYGDTRDDFWPSIDNIVVNESVTAVPEPSTYALMLGGLGLVGFMARRRKQQA